MKEMKVKDLRKHISKHGFLVNFSAALIEIQRSNPSLIYLLLYLLYFNPC